jgi:hypothetical protein
MKKLFTCWIIFLITGYLSYLSVPYMDNLLGLFGISYGDAGFYWFNFIPGILFVMGVFLTLHLFQIKLRSLTCILMILFSTLGYAAANLLIFRTMFSLVGGIHRVEIIGLYSSIGFSITCVPFLFRKEIKMRMYNLVLGAFIAFLVALVQSVSYEPTGEWGPKIPIDLFSLFLLWHMSLGLFVTFVLSKQGSVQASTLPAAKFFSN